MKHYHYIFAGAGLATLMTVYKMILSQKFEHKNILILDQNQKTANDRTWCFWSKEITIWDHLISKSWRMALFADADFQQKMDLKPYQYHKIQGLDLYQFVLKIISEQKNIEIKYQKVTATTDLNDHVLVQTNQEHFTTDTLLNSVFEKNELSNQTKYAVLQQHFVGWFVECEQEIFDPSTATFMDFSVEQKANTRFMYVLPTTKKAALVEYTLFSKNLLPFEAYETEIVKYLEKMGAKNYTIIEKEQGSIPMSCYPFWKKNSKNIINIGTAGGWTKPSTGFTFRNCDQKSTELVAFLQTQKNGRLFYKKTKFWWYDLLFVEVLSRNNAIGHQVFGQLFRRAKPSLIFKFLDQKTTFAQDIQVMLRCPKTPFLKALFTANFKNRNP